MRVHGNVMWYAELIYIYLKRHFCHKCGARLKVVNVSHIVNLTQMEEKKHFRMGNRYYYGKSTSKSKSFYHPGFQCPSCRQTIFVQDMKTLEKSRKMKQNFEKGDGFVPQNTYNMKLYKFQRISSVIPFFSTMFILIVTMIELKRRKAAAQQWIQFFALVLAAALTVFLLSAYVLTGKALILTLGASAIVTTLANMLMVALQEKCYRQRCEDGYPEKSRAYEKTILFTMLGWLVTAVIVTIIVASVALIRYAVDSVNYEDTNGPENTALQQINLEEMLSTESGFISNGSIQTTSGARTGVDWNLEEYDYDTIQYRCKKLNGIMTLQATKIEKGTLILDIDTTLESGNAEIIIIIDGEHHSHIPVNQAQTIVLEEMAGKTVVVRAAFESAKVNITLERRITESA